MSDKDSAVEFNQTTLTPFSDVGKDGDLVAAVRKIIGAEGEIERQAAQGSDDTVVKQVHDALRGETGDEPEPQIAPKKRVDGRTKEFKAAVARIANTKSKESSDKSKSYKETMKRINTRRNRGGI